MNTSGQLRAALFAALFLVATAPVAPAQQRGDESYAPSVRAASFGAGRGPLVLYDVGHNNLHRFDGGDELRVNTYLPFKRLLKADGFRVETIAAPITPASLAPARILVIVNPAAVPDVRETTPEQMNAPAYRQSEIAAIDSFVARGGALLLVADHYPVGGAASELSSSFGVVMSNGWVTDSSHEEAATRALVFSADRLGRHPILSGRNESERVSRVGTFTGQSLQARGNATILLRLGAAAFETDAHTHAARPVGGLAQGVALSFGRGRVVILGEAAMLTSQVTANGVRWGGLSAPGLDNEQFALNAMRWLAGLLPSAVPAQQVPAASRLRGNEHFRLLARAESLAANDDPARAIPLFARLLENEPRDPVLWDGYARALTRLGRLDEAVIALKREIEVGTESPTFVEYRIARTFALLNKADSAMTWADRAVRDGYEVRPQFATDTAFVGLRSNPRFKEIAGITPGPRSRDEAWRYDIDFLVAEAQRLHAGFDRPALSEPFVRFARVLRERVPALSDDEIKLGMRELLVLLGDGHSNVFARFTRFPIDLYAFSDGVFIIRGIGSARRLVGSQVLKLGSKPIEEAMSDVARFASRDNDAGLLFLGPPFLGQSIVLRTIGAVLDTGRLDLTIRAPTGRMETVVLDTTWSGSALLKLPPPPGLATEAPAYVRDTATIALYPLGDLKAAYVLFNQVAHPPGSTIGLFAQRLKTTLLTSGARHLIIDIRNNSGGNTYILSPLISAIIHFRESHPDNRVWVITGRRTFSGAQNFAAILERHVADIVFVGEPTGSRPNFVGESPPVVLPYSGLSVTISSRYHQNADFTDKRRWILPQVPTPLSSKDYFANRDPAMEAIRSLILRLPPSQTTPAVAQRPTRSVRGPQLTSSDLPALRISLDSAFRFVGVVPFRIRDVATGERFVFVDASRTTVRRMVIAQFEAIDPTSTVRYNYSFAEADTIAGHRFRENPFAFSSAAAARENPQGEAALTASFLKDQGYQLGDELMSIRYLTVPDTARRHELIIFYGEPLAPTGVRLSELYAQDAATPVWMSLARTLATRARRAFTLLPLGTTPG